MTPLRKLEAMSLYLLRGLLLLNSYIWFIRIHYGKRLIHSKLSFDAW